MITHWDDETGLAVDLWGAVSGGIVKSAPAAFRDLQLRKLFPFLPKIDPKTQRRAEIIAAGVEGEVEARKQAAAKRAEQARIEEARHAAQVNAQINLGPLGEYDMPSIGIDPTTIVVGGAALVGLLLLLKK